MNQQNPFCNVCCQQRWVLWGIMTRKLITSITIMRESFSIMLHVITFLFFFLNAANYFPRRFKADDGSRWFSSFVICSPIFKVRSSSFLIIHLICNVRLRSRGPVFISINKQENNRNDTPRLKSAASVPKYQKEEKYCDAFNFPLITVHHKFCPMPENS